MSRRDTHKKVGYKHLNRASCMKIESLKWAARHCDPVPSRQILNKWIKYGQIFLAAEMVEIPIMSLKSNIGG